MRPAEKVALLTALSEATKAQLDLAKAEALALADTVGVKSFNTDFGALTIAWKGEAPMVTDEAKVLAYVKEAFPTEVEVITRVRPSFTKALLGRVEWDPDTSQFIDTKTGEAVPGLGWSEKGEPYITWPAGDAQRETKTESAQWFASRTDELLSGMAALTRSPHVHEAAS